MNRNAFNKTARAYDKATTNVSETYKEQRIILQRLIPDNGFILDAACGPGRDVKYYAQKGYKVIGIDISEKLLNIAKKKTKKLKNVDLYLMDMTNIDLPEDSIDGILCSAGLLCLSKSDADKAVKEFNRVLKPKGIIYSSIKMGDGEKVEFDKRFKVDKFTSYYSSEEFKNLFENNGFIQRVAINYVSVEELNRQFHSHNWIWGVFEKKNQNQKKR
ncbi:class I SAM-dependent methyltransferase [Nanoarchaeota archaeon]